MRTSNGLNVPRGWGRDRKMIDVDKIIALENGELSNEQAVDVLAELIGDGTAWRLQGWYGRMAKGLIEEGYVSPSGEVLRYPGEEEE